MQPGKSLARAIHNVCMQLSDIQTRTGQTARAQPPRGAQLPDRRDASPHASYGACSCLRFQKAACSREKGLGGARNRTQIARAALPKMLLRDRCFQPRFVLLNSSEGAGDGMREK